MKLMRGSVQLRQIRTRWRPSGRSSLLSLGEPDAMDLISYGGMEEAADYLCIDDVYMRTPVFPDIRMWHRPTGWIV